MHNNRHAQVTHTQAYVTACVPLIAELVFQRGWGATPYQSEQGRCFEVCSVRVVVVDVVLSKQLSAGCWFPLGCSVHLVGYILKGIPNLNNEQSACDYVSLL